MRSSLFVLLFALISYLTVASAVYTATPVGYGTGSLNFTWNYIGYYGDLVNSTTSVISSPNDFILTSDGRSLILVDALSPSLRVFAKNNFTNFVQLNISSLPTVFSYEQISSEIYWAGVLGALGLINTTSSRLMLIAPTSLSTITGLAYDGQTTLYVADFDNARVLAYRSNLASSAPIRIYGKQTINDTTQPQAPTINNIGSPYRLRLDCFGNLWVADATFVRFLRFPAGSSTPDLVWGQTSFTSTYYGEDRDSFTNPFDIVFSQDCSVAFVADEKRILRFRAPFGSAQPAEAVLGASSFIVPGSFGTITRIQLEDYRNGTGLLYIMDGNYNRIVVGSTSWAAASPAPSGSVSASMSSVNGGASASSSVAQSGNNATSASSSRFATSVSSSPIQIGNNSSSSQSGTASSTSTPGAASPNVSGGAGVLATWMRFLL
eukprot:TRINITY_DN5922_c0_g1_i1.p1 TRINITY_DN5922_c0_g1~~TRINITY_DN5922_c0_g1_i1.p1  ORF type:complete len:444 (-),score=89.74 TRINITY_DN5922_c0_g1_i1:31-1335(-)